MLTEYLRHVFICTASTCAEGDPSGLRLRMHQLLVQRLGEQYVQQVKLTKCNCLAQCGLGPNMVIYPEAVWYKGVKLRDIEEIVERHLIGGEIVERLLNHKPAALVTPLPKARLPS